LQAVGFGLQVLTALMFCDPHIYRAPAGVDPEAEAALFDRADRFFLGDLPSGPIAVLTTDVLDP